MFDLNWEMDLASDACPPSRVIAAGLDWQRCWDAGGIGLVRAETHKNGTYQPVDEGGRLLWVSPAFHGPVAPSTLADLVAWSPDDPGRWWCRLGEASVVGYGNVLAARQAVWDFGDGSSAPTLTLHPTPRDYSLAGFGGAVVLDWRYGLGELDGIERLYCARYYGFAGELESRFRQQRRIPPQILVDDPHAQRAT